MSLRRYKIVAGVDLTEYSDIVIEHALDQAARHASPELHFLTVRERRKQTSDDLHRRLAGLVYPALETFNRHSSDWRARLHVRRGRPGDQIAGLAADVRADLIVIGSFSRRVPSRVLQNAICPTLVSVMPKAQDASPHCNYCDAVREDTDGERLFCDKHCRSHLASPMTTWSGGVMMW